MPSPGMVTTVYFAMIPFLPYKTFYPEELVKRRTCLERSRNDALTCLRVQRGYRAFVASELRSPGPEEGVRPTRASSQSQPLRYQFLHSVGDHERLRHAAKRRERELFATPRNRAGGEIDVDVVSGNNCFLFGCNLRRKLLAQLLHQLRNFYAEKAVVICVSQVRLREAGSYYQENTFRLEASDRLLTT